MCLNYWQTDEKRKIMVNHCFLCKREAESSHQILFGAHLRISYGQWFMDYGD